MMIIVHFDLQTWKRTDLKMCAQCYSPLHATDIEKKVISLARRHQWLCPFSEKECGLILATGV